MTAAIPFESGASLARVVITPSGWKIDARGPHSCRSYFFASAGETAEFVIALRDEGGWPIRFGEGTASVRAIVDDLTNGRAE